jgi:hypothetical protein
LPHFLTLSFVLHEVVVGSVPLSLNSYKCHQPPPLNIVVPKQTDVKAFMRSKVALRKDLPLRGTFQIHL